MPSIPAWKTGRMPESPEEIHARVVAAAGADGRLPMPPVEEWEIFPWELVDGELRPKVVRSPYDGPEPARAGADGVDCFNCTGDGTAVKVWENQRWKLAHPPAPKGLPLVLWLSSKAAPRLPGDGRRPGLASTAGSRPGCAGSWSACRTSAACT